MDRMIERPNLGSRDARRRLHIRERPYWTLLHYYGRHIGYHKTKAGGYWVGRFRTLAGSYRAHRLGAADDRAAADGTTILTYDQAWDAARAWFRTSAHKHIAAEERRRGLNEHLSICPIGMSSLSDTRFTTTRSGSAWPPRRATFRSSSD